MGARNLTELPVKLIQAQIQNNIAAALADVRTDRSDSLVNVETPPNQSYFIYAGAKGYRAPAVFTVPQDIDFKLTRGQNFVDATMKIIVSVAIEDRNQNNLNYKAWRYLDAFHNLLQGIELVDANSKIKIVISVMHARYSADENDKTDNSQVFRKEVAFDCDVEIYESL